MPSALKESYSSDGIPLLREYSHVEKRRLHTEEKRRVANRAAQLVKSDDTVFLGAGTTVEYMVRYLPDAHLRVITNSISVFKLLEHNEQCELYLVGGLYRQQTGCFVGGMAEEAIAPLGIDKPSSAPMASRTVRCSPRTSTRDASSAWCSTRRRNATRSAT